MLIGVPKEIKNHEYRVGLTPGSVREYVAHGHEVLVETGGKCSVYIRAITVPRECRERYMAQLGTHANLLRDGAQSLEERRVV